MIELVAYAIVCVAGVARIALAVTVDHIGHHLRDWFHPESFMGMLLSCTDCFAFWVALAVWFVWLVSPALAALLMLPWALSYAASLAARRY